MGRDARLPCHPAWCRSQCPFFRDEDKPFFLDALAVLAPADGVAVHAYVLMTNHVHLLMTAEGDEGLARLMKRLRQRSIDPN
ncbi:transposase [Thiocystis violacea]|uniref:transposase n=1 Tax=Thiocystis violacea TaxID=13725 RepID=UPI001907FD05|nr:transposase [Thiocystis violacea]